jgi:TonB family protein
MPQRESFEAKYEILETIGQGGMGAVYRVRNRLLDQLRVIKVIRSPLEPTPELAERFLREARTASRLRHPNLAILHDFGLARDGAFLVFEPVDGLTLREALLRHGIPPLALTLDVGRQVCRVLDYLHGQRIVLRGISLGDLMLSCDSEGWPLVKLIEPGLTAILEREQADLGNASPEQLAGELIDERSDVYALGAVLYELLTGRPPAPGNDGDDDFAVSDPKEQVPDDLRALVLHALALDPAERIGSAEELELGLAAVQARFPLAGDEIAPLFEAPSRLLDRPPLDEITWGSRVPRGGEGLAWDPIEEGVPPSVVPARPPHRPMQFLPAALPVGVMLVLAFFIFLKGRPWWNPQVGDTPVPPMVAMPPAPVHEEEAAVRQAPPVLPEPPEAAPIPVIEETPEEALDETPEQVPEPALEQIAEQVPEQVPERPAPKPALKPEPPVRIAEARPEPRPVVPSAPVVPVSRGPMRRGDLIGPGPGVSVPVPLDMPRFAYPASARGQGLAVDIRLDLLVDENGKVIDAKVREGDASDLGFNEIALAAARQVPFQPGMRNDVPGKMWTEMIFEFADPAERRSGR